ncbi:hypothetical protein SK128_023634, partial [Halocaridina rubra]
MTTTKLTKRLTFHLQEGAPQNHMMKEHQTSIKQARDKDASGPSSSNSGNFAVILNLSGEKRFEVKQEITSRGIRHTLYIRNPGSMDFGIYNFSVHNEYGSDGVEVNLKEK